MLNVRGNKRVIQQQGKLGLAKHVNILLVLEKRALRFINRGKTSKDQDEVLYKEALDETETVETADLSDYDANLSGGEHKKTIHNNINLTGRNEGNRGRGTWSS